MMPKNYVAGTLPHLSSRKRLDPVTKPSQVWVKQNKDYMDFFLGSLKLWSQKNEQKTHSKSV